MALEEESYRTWLQGRPADGRPDSPFYSKAEASPARRKAGRGEQIRDPPPPLSHEADEALAKGRALLEENEKLRKRLRFLGLDVPEPDHDKKRQNEEAIGAPPKRAVSMARELLRRRYPGVHQAASVMMRSEDPDAAEAAAIGLNLDDSIARGVAPDEFGGGSLRPNRGDDHYDASGPQGPLSTALRQQAAFLRDLRLSSLSEAAVRETQQSLAKTSAEVEDARRRSQSFRKSRQGRTSSSGPDGELVELKEQLAAKRDRIRELRGTIERLEKWPQDFARHEKLQTIFGQYTEKAVARDILKRWNELALWSSGKDPISYKYPVGAAADELYPPEMLKAGHLQVHIQRANGLKNVGYNVLGDLSDPYVVLRLGEDFEASTETIWDNLDPVWAKSNLFTFPATASDYVLRLEVFSENNVQQDDSLGTAECYFRTTEWDRWNEESAELFDGTLAACGRLFYRVRFSAEGPDSALLGQKVSGKSGRPDPEGPATGLSGAAKQAEESSEEEGEDEEFNVWSEDEDAAEERRKQAEYIMIEEQNRQKAGNVRPRNPEAMAKASNARDRRNKTKAKKKAVQKIDEGGPTSSKEAPSTVEATATATVPTPQAEKAEKAETTVAATAAAAELVEGESASGEPA